MVKFDSTISLGTIITLAGVIIAILTLASSYSNFEKQIQLQRDEEINEHISNIRSLELETRQNINLINNLVNKKDFFLQKTIHGQLVLENLKSSVSDGKISNEFIKSFTIKAFFEGSELNQRILFINSPEFSSLNIQKIGVDTIQRFKNQTIEIVNNTYKPTFVDTLNLVESYRECLEEKRDISFCNKKQYTANSRSEIVQSYVAPIDALYVGVGISIAVLGFLVCLFFPTKKSEKKSKKNR